MLSLEATIDNPASTVTQATADRLLETPSEAKVAIPASSRTKIHF